MNSEPVYYFSDLKELKENYCHFYHELKAYLATFDPNDHWAFQHGWDVDCDGTVF